MKKWVLYMCNVMKIATWNMRFVYKDGDGINNFIHRAGMVNEKIVNEKPDIITFQEIVPESLNMLKRMLPEYDFFGHFKEADYVTGGGLYTAIRKDTFDIIALETFWLSETPYIPGTRYKNQSPVPRTCIMTMVRNKLTGELMRVFNVHLDHISDEARVLGIKCILEFIKDYNKKLKYPVILMGDFNSRPDGKAIELTNREFKDITGNIDITFHGYSGETEKIDYIFLSEEFNGRVNSVGVWDDVTDGIYLSDHYPVSAEIKNL